MKYRVQKVREMGERRERKVESGSERETVLVRERERTEESE
jgi:hypothetical protein